VRLGCGIIPRRFTVTSRTVVEAPRARSGPNDEIWPRAWSVTCACELAPCVKWGCDSTATVAVRSISPERLARGILVQDSQGTWVGDFAYAPRPC